MRQVRPVRQTERVLSKVLRHIRRRAKIKQLAMAAEIGVSRSLMCELELGNRRPNPVVLQRWADALMPYIGGQP